MRLYEKRYSQPASRIRRADPDAIRVPHHRQEPIDTNTMWLHYPERLIHSLLFDRQNRPDERVTICSTLQTQ